MQIGGADERYQAAERAIGKFPTRVASSCLSALHQLERATR